MHKILIVDQIKKNKIKNLLLLTDINTNYTEKYNDYLSETKIKYIVDPSNKFLKQTLPDLNYEIYNETDYNKKMEKIFESLFISTIQNKINNISIKDCSKGTIILAKRVHEKSSQYYFIEKTSRSVETRIKEWGDRIQVFTIDTDGVDILEKILHMTFDMCRIKRTSAINKNKKEIEWFDFTKQIIFNNQINTKDLIIYDLIIYVIQKFSLMVNNKIALLSNILSKVNINIASEKELMTLAGIGVKTANNIITHRKNKVFDNIEQLCNVKSIGPGKYNKIKDYIIV